MAIITEQFTENGTLFTRTYSDTGRFVVRDGESYSEAIDPAEYGRTYTEGALMEPEGTNDDDILAAKAEAFDILTGEVE